MKPSCHCLCPSTGFVILVFTLGRTAHFCFSFSTSLRIHVKWPTNLIMFPDSEKIIPCIVIKTRALKSITKLVPNWVYIDLINIWSHQRAPGDTIPMPSRLSSRFFLKNFTKNTRFVILVIRISSSECFSLS